MAPAMASPSGGAPEKASRLELCETGACGGDKILLKERWRVSVFIGNYGGGNRSVGVTRGPTSPGGAVTYPLAAPPALMAGPGGSSRLLLKLPGSFVVQKKSSKIGIVFGPFLVLIFCETKNKQKTGTGTGH